jgi:nucleotide-binding universal stress UspA family protein
MQPKKIFFPIGAGDELEERIRGALIASKFFNTHLDILTSESKVDIDQFIKNEVSLLSGQLKDELLDGLEAMKAQSRSTEAIIFERVCKELDITMSDTPIPGKPTARRIVRHGKMSELVCRQSKFYDLVIAATPPDGSNAATFEASVVCSGKPVLVIPRVMTTLQMDRILVGWNDSAESSRAITEAIPLLQKAKEVKIVSTEGYTTGNHSHINDLLAYLALHDIEATFELIKTTFIPGEALLNSAKAGDYDMIVAGAYGRKGLKEMMLGGSAAYLLEHTTIPTLVSH